MRSHEVQASLTNPLMKIVGESLDKLMGFRFQIGDLVIKNPATWQPNEFDAWGRGEGIGVVVEPPFTLEDLATVDVSWPSERCFELEIGLLPASIPPDSSVSSKTIDKPD
jgi:hypothetical protein